MNSAVTVTIAGQEYRLACRADDSERMLSLAADLDDQLGALAARHPGLAPRALAVVAALTLTDKLRAAEADNEELRARCAALEAEREARALDGEAEDTVVLAAVLKAAETVERLTALLNNDLKGAAARAGGAVPETPEQAVAHEPAWADQHGMGADRDGTLLFRPRRALR